MAEGIALYQQMLDTEEAMEWCTDLLRRLDESLPEAEELYELVKFERYVELKAEHGATAAREIIRGDPDVAHARRERDELRCQRQTAVKELSRLTSVHLRLRDDVNREWARPSNQ
jgi:hypothetical protein